MNVQNSYIKHFEITKPIVNCTFTLLAFLFSERLPAMESTNNTSPRIYINNNGIVFLHLVDSKRNIGTISADGTTYTKTIIPTLHIHRKTKSVGFNYELLRDGNFSWVIVKADGYQNLVTSRRYILQHGFFLYFKHEGFEKQIFLPIDEFGLNIAREFEKQLNKKTSIEQQMVLFGEVA